MATTPVEYYAPSGLTLTLLLFPYGSDTIANGATGDGATERTSAKGVYSADVTQALSGWHDAVIMDGSANVIGNGAVYLHDTTDIHRVEEPSVRVYAVLPNAAPGAVDGVFIAGTNAETTVTTAINANIIGDITGTLDTVTTVGTVTNGVVLASSEDVYHADIQLTVDGTNTQDEYTATWFKNGVRVTSGITVPKIQVVKRADGANLVALTAMTQIGSTGSYKYDEATNRTTAGEAALAIATATIDGVSRTFSKVVTRDSLA